MLWYFSFIYIAIATSKIHFICREIYRLILYTVYNYCFHIFIKLFNIYRYIIVASIVVIVYK